MCDRTPETQHVLALQADMFRLAKRDYALTYTRLSLLSGVPTTTLESWGKGTAMPLYGFVKLAPHIPDDLLSMVMEPAGKLVCSPHGGDGDIHDLHSVSAHLAHTVAKATHPKSPGGVHVVPSERGEIRDIARAIAPVAMRVAAA